MQAQAPAEKLLRAFDLLARKLIAFPNDFRAATDEVGRTVYLNVDCHADDYGKLIGSRGRHFNWFSLVLQNLAHTEGVEFRLVVNRPQVGQVDPNPPPFAEDPNFDNESLRVLLAEVASLVQGESVYVKAEPRPQFTVFILAQPKGVKGKRMKEWVPGLAGIAHAIGKAQGRVVYVDSQ